MNTHVDGLIRLAWTQSWQVTAVAIVVGSVVRLCGRNRPRLSYALWMLVLAKAVVPPVWSSPTGLFSWVQARQAESRTGAAGGPSAARVGRPASERGPGGPAPAAIGAPGGLAHVVDAARSRVGIALLAAWSVGLVLGVGAVMAKQFGLARLIRRSTLPAEGRHLSALADLSRRLGVRRSVRLVVTSAPIGPAAFGLLRPTILLPGSFVSGTSPEQIELILAHELVHIRRGDVLAGTLQLVAQLIWWFHPLVWWASRKAGHDRERCCDEEVLSGLGCRPALYARALINILEQKVRLRSLAALPGVRALEVTSIRLETIMRYAGIDHRRNSRVAKVAFAAGLVALIPGAGLTIGARSPVGAGPGTAVTTAPAEAAPRTMRGVVREKGTGRPVAGARVNVTPIADDDGKSHPSSSAVTDQAGRYTITDLPEARQYGLIASPGPGSPHFITSRKVEAAEAGGPMTADVEFVRGIRFRVRILDKDTGRPLRGSLSYFPVSPNNPFERGVMGYVGSIKKGGSVCGAFYEADPGDRGEFRGAVLPGPGILGFSHPYRPGDESRADRKPVVSFPDGKENVKLIPNDQGGPLGFVPIGADPIVWTGLPLGQFDAVIAIDPREGANEVTYEIRVPPEKATR